MGGGFSSQQSRVLSICHSGEHLAIFIANFSTHYRGLVWTQQKELTFISYYTKPEKIQKMTYFCENCSKKSKRVFISL